MHDNRAASAVIVSGGFKIVAVLAGIVGTFHLLTPLFNKEGLNITANGECSMLQFPEPYKLELAGPSGQRVELKSIWRFTIKNEGARDASELIFELPFNGFYKTTRPGVSRPSALSNFERTIKLDPLSASNEVSVLVWSDSAIDPGMERETKIQSPNGTFAIDYPVKVSGFMAWVERSKLLISVILLDRKSVV